MASRRRSSSRTRSTTAFRAGSRSSASCFGEVDCVALQTISVDISPRRIATVTLNRPDRGNAFDQTMLDELAEQCAALGASDNVRIVVLRGAGKHFCTGADLASRAPDAHAVAEPAKAPASL